MALVDQSADSLFISLSSAASLLGRFHPCGGRSALLLSRCPDGALALGCAGCHARVDGVRDELEPLVRRRREEIHRALGLDGADQERLLAVLRGLTETVQHQQQQQRASTDPQQQQVSTDPQQQQQQQQVCTDSQQQQQQRVSTDPQHQQDGGKGMDLPLQQQQQQEERPGSLGPGQQQHNSSERALPGQEQMIENVTSAGKKTKAAYKSARCEICSKDFYKRSNLRVHMLKHLGVRPHWCQKCGKSFSDPSTYSRHVASVCGGQRHLTCHVCGKAFYHQVHLKEHLRKHTGDKPYCCEECGKSYACQGSLRRHRRGRCAGHGAVGSHLCPVCGKAFRRPETLAAHCRLHAGVTLPPGRTPQQTGDGQTPTVDCQRLRNDSQTLRTDSQTLRTDGQTLAADCQTPSQTVRETLTAVSAAMTGSWTEGVHAQSTAFLENGSTPSAGLVAGASGVERTRAGPERTIDGDGGASVAGDRTCEGERMRGSVLQAAPPPILPAVNVTQVKPEMFAVRA